MLGERNVKRITELFEGKMSMLRYDSKCVATCQLRLGKLRRCIFGYSLDSLVVSSSPKIFGSLHHFLIYFLQFLMLASKETNIRTRQNEERQYIILATYLPLEYPCSDIAIITTVQITEIGSSALQRSKKKICDNNKPTISRTIEQIRSA